MTATVKKATGARATARTKPKTFDEKRAAIIAARKTSGRYEWDAYGQTWHVKRPNIALVGELEDADSIGAFTNYLIAHIDEGQRAEFLDELLKDEELDLDIITAMTEDLQELVYSELPTGPSASS